MSAASRTITLAGSELKLPFGKSINPPWLYEFDSLQRETGSRQVTVTGVDTGDDVDGAAEAPAEASTLGCGEATAPDVAPLHETRMTEAIGAAHLLTFG